MIEYARERDQRERAETTGQVKRRGQPDAAGGLQAVLGRLEALAGRVQEQASRLDEQAATIAAQQAWISGQEAEIARLKAAAGSPVPAHGAADGPEPKVGRRGMLTKLLGATAALGALAVATPQEALATSRTNSFGTAGAAPYGLLAIRGSATDPDLYLPPLGSTQHGVIGMTGQTFATPVDSAGVLGLSDRIGVLGLSSANYGVYGQTGNPGLGVGLAAVLGSSNGATGVAGASTNNSGVFGVSHGFGPFLGNPVGTGGTSDNNVGVLGTSTNNLGVRGESTNSSGVLGVSSGPSNPQPGVVGSATNGYGVFGFSQNSNGIAGQSGGGAAGCVGFAGAPGGYGIYGGTAVAGGYAGGFAGPVLVVGDFTATGGAKSAAVPHPDGTHRRLYCMESPESLFEDFGEGKLANGRGEVKLDPDFAILVHNDKYFVFLTEVGDSGGLYLAAQSPTGFEVRARGSASAGGSFYYRVVAKRKDIPAPRLEKVKLPEPIKELVKPDLPTPAEPPKMPEPLRPAR